MDYQILFIILLGFGALAAILFILDIYFLAKKAKDEKKEKNTLFLKFYEKFLQELEKTINKEIDKTISEINQKIAGEITESYKKQISNFSQKAESRAADFEENAKKEILKISDACFSAKSSILQDSKKLADQLGSDWSEKINQIYKTTEASIGQKIAQTEKYIEEYKKEKLKEIDQKIYQIIEATAKKTIGKTIDLSTHEELVVSALEKSKKETFFKP